MKGAKGRDGRVRNRGGGHSAAQIRAIAALGRDPGNWEPAGKDAVEQATEMANALADTYTDEDWRHVLNTLSPTRTAHQIACRPLEYRDHLLTLIDPARREAVQSALATCRTR